MSHYDSWLEANTTTHPKQKEFLLEHLAAQQDCPEDILLDLCQASVKVRRAVVGRVTLPEKVCTYLSRDCDERIREKIACHPDTPRDILLMLASSKNQQVALHVTQNPKCPPEVLLHVVTNTLWFHRRSCINHENMPHGIWCRKLEGNYTYPKGRSYMNLRTLP